VKKIRLDKRNNFGIIEGALIAYLVAQSVVVTMYNDNYDKNHMPETVKEGVIVDVNNYPKHDIQPYFSVKGKNADGNEAIRYVVMWRQHQYTQPNIGNTWSEKDDNLVRLRNRLDNRFIKRDKTGKAIKENNELIRPIWEKHDPKG